ncbi:unnamed protein product, partial [Ectocarpus sp. 12 AP-2014]
GKVCRGRATLCAQSQAIDEKVLGLEHPSLAKALNNRAVLLADQGRYDEADLLYLRVNRVLEKTLGPDHPDLASSLRCRAELFQRQVRVVQDDELYRGR